MKFSCLENTGVQVSTPYFGTMSFGGDADEEAPAMFNRCRDAGNNFFDCTIVYSGGRSGADR